MHLFFSHFFSGVFERKNPLPGPSSLGANSSLRDGKLTHVKRNNFLAPLLEGAGEFLVVLIIGLIGQFSGENFVLQPSPCHPWMVYI